MTNSWYRCSECGGVHPISERERAASGLVSHCPECEGTEALDASTAEIRGAMADD